MFYTLSSIFCNVLNLFLGNKLPPLSSTSLVVEEHGRFLMLRHSRKRVIFPGGLLKWNEAPEETAERKGEEQTGLVLRITGFINFYSLPGSRWNRPSLCHFVFAGEVVGGSLRHKACWLPEAEVRRILKGQELRMFNDYLDYRNRNRSFLQATQPTAPLVPLSK
ncbi:NUDIX domain-containing protein [Thermosporothrix hazakensis]|jgi:ADP-ribose pyrophosphatase YjhB (NUDIX family)|uniref:NUDIX domain-containing protein n=2 Tax=Thermosporothrix TaxID=768650 RepID=A0A326U2H0_THEHA|nr:NUDIX hydrolase [Thermosporothrix hazakensis]PZW25642.1 NUDIX domain-containing protein [Thermosporothrix hazakensis]BBH89937.1 hypothetical protein KTC_46880 [Thermosporothrix sp. COM3]GCE48137.1 hypothetical protein KTH_30060 [Thermosporothrix hazakensis]